MLGTSFENSEEFPNKIYFFTDRDKGKRESESPQRVRKLRRSNSLGDTQICQGILRKDNQVLDFRGELTNEKRLKEDFSSYGRKLEYIIAKKDKVKPKSNSGEVKILNKDVNFFVKNHVDSFKSNLQLQQQLGDCEDDFRGEELQYQQNYLTSEDQGYNERNKESNEINGCRKISFDQTILEQQKDQKYDLNLAQLKMSFQQQQSLGSNRSPLSLQDNNANNLAKSSRSPQSAEVVSSSLARQTNSKSGLKVLGTTSKLHGLQFLPNSFSQTLTLNHPKEILQGMKTSIKIPSKKQNKFSSLNELNFQQKYHQRKGKNQHHLSQNNGNNINNTQMSQSNLDNPNLNITIKQDVMTASDTQVSQKIYEKQKISSQKTSFFSFKCLGRTDSRVKYPSKPRSKSTGNDIVRRILNKQLIGSMASSFDSPKEIEQQIDILSKDNPSDSHNKKQSLRMKKAEGQQQHVQFKWNQFFQSMILYIMYIFLLGPLASFLARFWTGSFHLAYNLGLYGRHAYQFPILFLIFIGITAIQISQNTLLQFTFYLEFVFIYLLIFLMTSIKYGYMQTIKFNRYLHEYLGEDELLSDQLRNGWKLQTDDIIEKEILDSLSRNEVEHSSFLLEFIQHPSKSVLKNLLSYKQYINVNTAKKLKVFNQERDPSNLINATSILVFLIQFFNEKCSDRHISAKAAVLTCIRAAYCLGFKVYSISSSDKLEILKLIIMVLAESYCIFFFLEIAYILGNDLKRKEFLMIQLSYLVSAKKVETVLTYNQRKLLPTMTMGCPISIRSWSQMRQTAMDYGSRYEMRSNTFLSTYLFFFYAGAFLLILNFLGIISLTSSSVSELLILSFDLIIFFILIMKSFATAAAVNQQFAMHLSLLMSNKMVFAEISLNYALYSNEKLILTNHMYLGLLRNFKQIIKTLQINHPDLQEYAWYIQAMYSSIAKELRISEEFKPLKVINIVVSKNLVIQLIISALSSLLALLWDTTLRPYF